MMQPGYEGNYEGAVERYDKECLLGDQSIMKPTILNPSSSKSLAFMKKICLCTAFFGLGLCLTVPQNLLFADFSNFSLPVQIFLGALKTQHVGCLFGAIFAGYLFDKYNSLFLMFMNLLTSTICIFIIPWCSIKWLNKTVFTLLGACLGFLQTGANILCMDSSGKHNGVLMHLAYFILSLGMLFAPIRFFPDTSSMILTSQLKGVPSTKSNNSKLAVLTVDGINNVFNQNIIMPSLNFSLSSEDGINEMESVNNFVENSTDSSSKLSVLASAKLLTNTVDLFSSESYPLSEFQTNNTNNFLNPTMNISSLNVTNEENMIADNHVMESSRSQKQSSKSFQIPESGIRYSEFQSSQSPAKALKIMLKQMEPGHIHAEDLSISNKIFNSLSSNIVQNIFFNSTENVLNGSKMMKNWSYNYYIVGTYFFFVSSLFLIFLHHNPRLYKMTHDEFGFSSCKVQYKFQLCIIFLLAVLMFLTGGLATAYCSLLPSFIKTPRVSLFLSILTLTRFFSIFIVNYIHPRWIILISSSLLLISSSLLVFSSPEYIFFIQVSTIFLAIGLACMMPSMMIFAAHYFTITSKVTSMFIFGQTLGEMFLVNIVSRIAGTCFNMFSYSICFIVVLIIFIFFIVLIICKYGVRNAHTGYSLANQHDLEDIYNFSVENYLNSSRDFFIENGLLSNSISY